MVGVSLTIRSVLVECLQHLLIQSNDHDVWPKVEFITASHRMRLVGHPFTNIHVRDSDAPHVGRATGKTVLDELQKNLIKAAGLIVRIPRNRREASPFTRSSPMEPVFT